jgi:hypothetical protein
MTITKKRPIPAIGPVATNEVARAAGKNIPNPLIPITFRLNAITKATTGNRRRRTIVFSGTPEAIARSIAYLTGLPNISMD